MPAPRLDLEDTYFALSRQLHSSNEKVLRRKTDLVFKDVPLRGRSVLDIGGGDGTMSYYAASQGARRTVCLEPAEAGSNPEMEHRFLTWQAGLGSEVKVDLVRETFQDLDPQTETFNVVLIHNAINHLDEDACARLRFDPDARERYRIIFRKLADLTTLNGDLIITDAARKNAWNTLGRRSPFAPTIEWHIHQQPKLWQALAADAGFSEVRTTWRSHDKLGTVGQSLLGNVLGGWITNSSFILQLRRVD